MRLELSNFNHNSESDTSLLEEALRAWQSFSEEQADNKALRLWSVHVLAKQAESHGSQPIV
jgi:hypothetical protein